MSQQDLLNKVIQILSDLGIEYMVTGSIASSLHGEPRATHDIDLVVNIEHSHVSELTNAFLPPAYFLDEQAVHSAIDGGGMFNLALRVYEVQAGIIDHEYIDQWVIRLSIEDLWNRLRSDAEIL